MSSEAEQSTRWRSLRVLIGLALVFLIMLATLTTAEAKDIPTQLIIFTDKKVYTDWTISSGKGSLNTEPVYQTGSGANNDLRIWVFAVVLDDDGNIMRGRNINLSGSLNFTRRLDHYHNSTKTTHHNSTPLNPATLGWNNFSLTFADNGGLGDTSGDGIYTAMVDLIDVDATSGPLLGDDHILINLTVKDNGIAGTGNTKRENVLLSSLRCHQTSDPTSHSTHTGVDGTTDLCTVCHAGQEHFFETISKTIPDDQLDVHTGTMNPLPIYSADRGYGGFVWNRSNFATGGVKTNEWDSVVPGSRFCAACHFNRAGTTGYLYDYGSGDRSNANDRPSCNAASVSQNTASGGVEQTLTCHATTPMQGVPSINWAQASEVSPSSTSNDHAWNYNLTKSKSHNHSTSLIANVSCAICHGVPSHGLKMPNMSANIERGSGNINDQCVLCHNITGGLNITSNGGRNENHTNPNCKACHIDQSVKMDSHLVPVAGIPNANCTECHDIGGISPNHIDFSVFNKSDYVHNQYNASKGLRPLNFNASNGSALRPSENKICWGCHGDDPNNDGLANFSEQPAGNHPQKYRNARLCEECHQNASSPWKAPKNVAHSYNTVDVRTPGAPDCYDCHGQPVMFNNSRNDADFNESNELKGVKASVANHYGTGFPELAKINGSDAYCIKYCHQNTSSPFELEFYNKENMQRPNHSAMTSRSHNQSCTNEQCHAADRLHDEKMRKPTLAGGTFGNGNCTAPGCHSPSNYSFHNGASPTGGVNCTSCHMDNTGANIHPIKYLQNDGTDFAQVNLTAASCKLCHKNSQGDTVMNRWGVTPRKVGSQHHSGDPENGSKWNRTIQPYWDYMPNQINFVTGFVNNSYRGFIENFEAMKNTNSSAGTISENVTEDVLAGHYPSNNDFNVTVQSGGWYANGTATTKSWSNLPADGNPNGSLIIASTTKSQVVDAIWSASFVYNKTAKVADASIKLDSKLIKAKNINKASLKAINVTIEDKYGNSTEVFNRSLPDVPEIDWSLDEKTIQDPDAVFWKNGTLDHTYNVTLRTRWTGLGGSLVPDIKVAYDNVFVNLSEVDYKKYNFIFYINSTPPSDRYNLIVGYQTHVEKARLYVLNGSSFKYRADLDSGAFTKAIIPISEEEYGSGNITLRINDSNGPGESDVNEIDVKPDYIDIDYMFIDSYKWINNSRVNYPCEYCHAPNKHSQHALGIPTAFMGNNSVGQDVNSSTTWCASCHYQGYVSGSNNYTDMIKAFLDHMLPVPPEITGHSQYGVNESQSPDYYQHSKLSSFDDRMCWNCHRGSLADGSTSTVFLHNVSGGTSGGRNCTACHGPGGSATGMLVNFTSAGKGMHAPLNRNASSTLQNASNKPCWGCHGTKKGTWANESDQPLNDHNFTYKQSARKCHDCHNDSMPLFGAKNVTDHIPSGLSGLTDVITSKYYITYCSYCHNNSIVASYDPDGFGASPMNASASHYGANRTANKLMSPGVNSTDCVFCHRNTSNMQKWGVLQGSTANINNKNASGGGTNHDLYTASSQCEICHGGYEVTQGFTFHNPALGSGGGGGSNCTACHDVGSPGTYPKVDFAAINTSIHGNLNSQASSSPENTLNKPCWGCHGTKTGTYANESDQPLNGHDATFKSYPRKCEDCHINGSIQFSARVITEHIMPGKSPLTEINVTEGYCSVCHNNSITVNWDSDGIGIFSAINASAAHYSKDANINLMTATVHSNNCTYCHFVSNGSTEWLTPRKPLTSTHSSYSNDTQPSKCWGCHVDSKDEPSTFHIQAINKGKGSGPDCRSCHNISDTDEAKGHVDIAVFNTSLHANMNTTAGTDLNEPCWGCHGNGNSDGHNTTGDSYGKGMYRNPYNCSDCHISTGIRYSWASARNALTVAEHYAGGTDIRASYNATTIYSCLNCHQNISEMRLSSNDADTNRTIWTSGGDTYAAIGGNNSPYHYGKKRQDIRSGVNASCSYCHQNITTAFESVMTNSFNKTIIEHTSGMGGNTTNSTLSCTGSNCHATGYIHNSTLSKPNVQAWTPGKKDYCAPCHRAGNINAAIYVYAHNTSNISVVNTDCGYCHNGSSQGIISTGALRLHTGTLTNTSTVNSSCTACHRDSTYVGISRIINTHYPNAPSGKANTSRSSWDCEECHGWSTGTGMHSPGIVKKPGFDCNACHNAEGSSPNKAYSTPFVNVTRHDNTSHNGANMNCDSCHNSTGRKETFHFTKWPNGTVEAPGWNGWINGTRTTCIDCHVTNANAAPFFAEPSSWHKSTYGSTLNDCYQCHSNLTVLSKDDIKAQVEIHNVTRAVSWNNCNLCHSNRYGGANTVDNASLSSGMHAGINGAGVNNIDPACRACHGGNESAHRNSTANDCTYCHITGRTKYGAKNVSEHIPNATYQGTQVNTSRYQQVSCDLCHNNSISAFIDDTPGSRNATSAHYGQNNSFAKLMNPEVNSSDCMYCHRNTSNMEKWGISPTSKANIANREDHSSFSSNVNCYDCHVDTKSMPQTFHSEELNEGAGSSPNCMGCHSITGAYSKVDFSATNQSNNIHKNLNSGANAAGYDSANKPCWACHGNGTATAHIVGMYKAPKLCENCHINSSKPFGAPQVSEHFRNGSDIKATNATNDTGSCLACHQNITEMRLSNNDPDAGSFDPDGDRVNGTGISAYHYGRKRTELRSGINTSCIYCHSNSSTPFPLSDTNRSIREHTEAGTGNITGGSCYGSKCHSSGLIHDTNLTKFTTQAWTPGGADYCAPCHKPGNASAEKYVYNQKHDPANSSGDRIGDCGFCHNASSQGINGGTIRIHTPTLTNTTSYALYGTCIGCHNSTSIFVGSSKQIFSHLPNGSQYRGNTSMSDYSCENCHNMTEGTSMHSAGMNRSNGTCITCHFNRISPFKAKVKIIDDYNHTYTGQNSCNITQCHNASGAALGFHLDKYAGAVVADPERMNIIWSNRNNAGNGFTDTPYVDCIDCHREYNNTFPFNNTYPFDYSTNYSFNYEANYTGVNKKIHSASDSMDSCYNCHTDITDIKNPQNRFKVHNVSIEPLLGGPACVSCHNKSAPNSTGYPLATRKVNHTAFNQSVHSKLANYTTWDKYKKPNSVLLDTACWVCHSTNLTELPNNAHPDRGGPASTRPFQCNECHTPEGNMSIINLEVFQGTPKIYQHYAGKTFINQKIFNSSKACYECHENSLVPELNISYGEYDWKGEANGSHYTVREDLIHTNLTQLGCKQCHAVGESGGSSGEAYGNAIGVPVKHNLMGSDAVSCQVSCHNSNPAVNITNHDISMGLYLDAGACYGTCHILPPCEECTR